MQLQSAVPTEISKFTVIVVLVRVHAKKKLRGFSGSFSDLNQVISVFVILITKKCINDLLIFFYLFAIESAIALVQMVIALHVTVIFAFNYFVLLKKRFLRLVLSRCVSCFINLLI